MQARILRSVQVTILTFRQLARKNLDIRTGTPGGQYEILNTRRPCHAHPAERSGTGKRRQALLERLAQIADCQRLRRFGTKLITVREEICHVRV